MVLVWQRSQDNDVTGTWFAITPFALVPLWQVAQVPAATPVWLNAAPKNDVVFLWQVSQPAVVATCVGGFDTILAYAPLWQFAQPVTIPV